MRIARVAAWCVLAAAVIMSSIDGSPRHAPPQFVDGYRVVAADLHVHAFPGDGVLPPWDIRREARRRGLDVVALTNHNQMLAVRLDRMLFPNPPPPLTLGAEELTAFGYHIAAIGIREPIDWRLPLAAAVRAVHAQGGIAIAAHPVDRLGAQIDDEALSLVDGIEVAHPVADEKPRARAQLDALYARAVRIKPTIAAIGSSDYHFGAPIGMCRTVIFARDLSQADVFEAIRAGRTVAIDRAGRAHGPARWTAAMSGTTLALPEERASELRNSGSVAFAWIALVFLVTFGRRNNP